MKHPVKPSALDGIDESRILDLDVRADLRSRRDPFERIMHARLALAHDGVLRVRAIFEPRPLYGVLGTEGFLHWTEQLGPDDWRVWFYRSGKAEGAPDDGEAAAPPTSRPEAASRDLPPSRTLTNCGSPRPDPEDIHPLDVRDLEPPEPLVQTLEALEALEPGDTLMQLNRRVPHFLLPQLEKRGFQYTIREDEPGQVRVFIRHAGESPVLDVRLLPPREKHPAIFETFDALGPGASFEILNDHDPVPLRYQFEAERGGTFNWIYVEEGPERWRVRIGRLA